MLEMERMLRDIQAGVELASRMIGRDRWTGDHSQIRSVAYRNQQKLADGYHGWPGYVPFDAVPVTAATPEVPQPLINQLKPDSRARLHV